MEGAELRIVDPQTGRELPAGERGEIWMRGVGLMPGYFRDPAATAAVIREGGWYASGDLGELHEDGALFVVGRLKEMIIRSGFNVYPAEVEAVLNAFPAIERSAVVGRPSRTATRTWSLTWNCATARCWTKRRCACTCRNTWRPTSSLR